MSEETRQKSGSWKLWARLGALVVLLVGSYVFAHQSGLTEELSRDRIRELMEGAGAWGFLLFLGVFAVGELLHIPGLVFVAAAILAYGQLLGGAAGYLGAVISVSVSFVVVRAVGGQPLENVKRPFLRKWLERLNDQPIRAVAFLRLLLWMAPPLNYALAMSGVRFRDYVVGSALGLAIPIAIVSLVFEKLLGWIL
ncbi:MAG: VTT domain-containing protein [Myxococcota bacterium]